MLLLEDHLYQTESIDDKVISKITDLTIEQPIVLPRNDILLPEAIGVVAIHKEGWPLEDYIERILWEHKGANAYRIKEVESEYWNTQKYFMTLYRFYKNLLN